MAAQFSGAPHGRSTRRCRPANITYQRTDLFNDTYQGYPAEILNWSKSRKIIGIIDYNMICGPHGNDTCPSWGLGTWNGAVANAIKWYPEVHIWEIWNEPQYGYSQSGYLTNDLPYNYSQMVKSAYRLIKVHNATDTVLCFGGDNIYSGGDGYDASFYQWAQLVWSTGQRLIAMQSPCTPTRVTMGGFSIRLLRADSTRSGRYSTSPW